MTLPDACIDDGGIADFRRKQPHQPCLAEQVGSSWLGRHSHDKLIGQPCGIGPAPAALRSAEIYVVFAQDRLGHVLGFRPLIPSAMSDDTIEDLLRRLAPQVPGRLVRRYGYFDLAEDAVQETLLTAARQWPDSGVPDQPRAWRGRRAQAGRSRPHRAGPQASRAGRREPGTARLGSKT
ncbi:hypothetical protein AB0C18_37875 [Nonomuraea muscovyensis]|uniref:hypothetical protein n=1 Tax=Nonomuraea muscovyensis TaxID=1124761 RepID=UPI0033C58B8C